MQTRSRINARARQLGQGMTEYIIITALIAIAAIAAVTFFGGTVRSQVGGMAKELGGESATTSISNAQEAAGNAEAEGEGNKGLANYQNDNARGAQ